MKHPVDIHVGQRVRHRRWMLGMTQQQLGDKIGVTIPQIQNYENGTNRISASRLWDIAAAMEVPVLFFCMKKGTVTTSASDGPSFLGGVIE